MTAEAGGLIVPGWIVEEAQAHAREVEREHAERRPRHPLIAQIEDAWPELPSIQDAEGAARSLFLLSLGLEELRWFLLWEAMTTIPSAVDAHPECPTLADVADLGREFIANGERELGVYRPEWAGLEPAEC